MAIASKFVIGFLVFLLVLLAGGVFLQIFLSKRESRWPGLVLPLLAFLQSLLLPLNLMDTGGEYPHAGSASRLLGGPGETTGAGPAGQNENRRAVKREGLPAGGPFSAPAAFSGERGDFSGKPLSGQVQPAKPEHVKTFGRANLWHK